MNLDKTIEAIESGMQSPQTMLYRTAIEDKHMEQVHLRRRATGVSHHQVWVFSISWQGAAAPAMFYGYKPTDAIKKAAAWRGVALGRKKKDASTSGQPQAG